MDIVGTACGFFCSLFCCCFSVCSLSSLNSLLKQPIFVCVGVHSFSAPITFSTCWSHLSLFLFCLCWLHNQEAIFKDVGLSALEKAWEGYNVAVLAYGTTGSGKSHTMLGSRADKGIVPLCCKHLFSQMSSNSQHKYKVCFVHSMEKTLCMFVRCA